MVSVEADAILRPVGPHATEVIAFLWWSMVRSLEEQRVCALARFVRRFVPAEELKSDLCSTVDRQSAQRAVQQRERALFDETKYLTHDRRDCESERPVQWGRQAKCTACHILLERVN